MKKLLTVALLVVGLATFAQEQKKQEDKRPPMEKLSAEQRNQLVLKKMTLELGLNDAQQKEMGKIVADQSAKREAAMAERKANKEKGVKPSADERFARENKKLDEQIATNEKVKKILTPEQFKKWEQIKEDRKEKRHAHAGKRGHRDSKPE